MHTKIIAALAAAFMLSASVGCQSTGGACGPGGCGGGLVGMMGIGGGCNDGSCQTPAQLSNDGYGPRPGMLGQHFRGPQSHMGGMPGPADGPPTPQVTYPYYTTRGPRDYFAKNPASIGP